MKTPTLFIPEHWPCAWWSGDNSVVRLSCPACGGFSLDLRRDQAGGIKALSCNACSLNGFAATQRAFHKVAGFIEAKSPKPQLQEAIEA